MAQDSPLGTESALGLTSPSAPPPRSESIELASKAGVGDVLALRHLIEIVAPRVVRAVRAVMGSRHPEVDDAVQLALLGFVQALPSFRGECDPAQFAARIAVRVARRLRQSAKARSKPTDRSVELDDLQGQPESQAGATPSAAFRDLFDGLREEQSEVLVLRIMLGWDLREIAEAGGDRRLPRRIDRARRDRRAE